MDNIEVLNYSYTILEETRFSDYTQFKIRYRGFDGAVLVAYVLSPLVETSNLLLVIPGHGIGAEGLISREVIDYQKSIGKVLAQNGYYVVVPELRSFGGLSASDKPILFANYAYALGKGVMHLWIMSCLTALKIAKDMMHHQTSHIGIVGCSLGGILALMLGALSDEVDLIVCASGLTSYVEVCAGKVDACELMYGMLKYFDYPDIAAAFAPRPLLVTYGSTEQGCFEFEARNLTSYNHVKKAYALMNAENQLTLVIHPEGHTYDVEASLDFLSANFP